MTTPICIFPWFHQLVETNGVVRPCCIWNGQQNHGYDSTNFFQSDLMKSLRESMLSGQWPDECNGCKRDEQLGRRSQRQLAWDIAKNMNYDHQQGPRLMSHEIHPSNVCNIRCRTCEPASSTKWSNDAHLIGMDRVGLLESGWHLTKDTAQTARRLLFLGGESLMHQDLIFESLHKVNEHGDLSQLEVVICTNMTLRLRGDIVDFLRRCQFVSFSCSIDGYGRLNDYIRSDSKWEDVVATCEQMIELCRAHSQIKMHIHPVVSIMNVNRLIDLFNWWDSLGRPANAFGYIWCHVPRYYDPRHLPSDYKSKLIDTYTTAMTLHPDYATVLQSIIAQLSVPNDDDAADMLDQFRRMTRILDDRRDMRFIDYNPDMAKVCGI